MLENHCFLPSSNAIILPNDAGIWDKVTHWKEYFIIMSFRDDPPCIIWTFGSLVCSGKCFQPLWRWSREWNFKDSWGVTMLLKPSILIYLMPTLSQTNLIRKVIFKGPKHCNCPVAWFIFTDIPKHTHGPFWSSIFSC